MGGNIRLASYVFLVYFHLHRWQNTYSYVSVILKLELQAMANVDAGRAITQEDKKSDGIETIGGNVENNHSLENSSKKAIDLIGAFDNHLKSTFGTSLSNVNTSMLDILPLLDLSLRRSQPIGSVNLLNDERPRMNHSDASPFSR